MPKTHPDAPWRASRVVIAKVRRNQEDPVQEELTEVAVTSDVSWVTRTVTCEPLLKTKADYTQDWKPTQYLIDALIPVEGTPSKKYSDHVAILLAIQEENLPTKPESVIAEEV